MHPDPQVVIWPDYQEFYRWLCQEVDGLTDAELDFDSHDPAHEWMWWSIRRQVSHMAWDLLIVMYRRCHHVSLAGWERAHADSLGRPPSGHHAI